VPPWDFDATGPDAGIMDTAAAAVVSSALLELGRLHPDPAAGAGWAGKGLAMLEALCREAFASEGSQRGLLKHSCYSKPHNEGVDSATMFGDFFFAEALCRVVMPGKFRPVSASAMPIV
jgi:unsaturated chondroitin disaccharide hydrolase